MVWFEGHRGFHQGVVQETVHRIRVLGHELRGARIPAAPLAACELAFAPDARLR